MKNKRKVVIFAAIHGDEVYGVELHKAFIERFPALKAYALLVIGNSKAYKEHTRYIDIDMNRAYGVSNFTHEMSEISRVEQELTSINPDYILDVHTTRRTSGAFFITDSLEGFKQDICNFLDLDICIMRAGYIGHSFVGTHPNAVSIEYSLDSINEHTTREFVERLRSLITGTLPLTSDKSRRVYEIIKIISKEDYESYNLKPFDRHPEGLALMVPRNASEMDAEYFGFWCKEVEHNA